MSKTRWDFLFFASEISYCPIKLDLLQDGNNSFARLILDVCNIAWNLHCACTDNVQHEIFSQSKMKKKPLKTTKV